MGVWLAQGEEDEVRDRPKPVPPTKEEIYKATNAVGAASEGLDPCVPTIPGVPSAAHSPHAPAWALHCQLPTVHTRPHGPSTVSCPQSTRACMGPPLSAAHGSHAPAWALHFQLPTVHTQLNHAASRALHSPLHVKCPRTLRLPPLPHCGGPLAVTICCARGPWVCLEPIAAACPYCLVHQAHIVHLIGSAQVYEPYRFLL